ncbi:hypothetical protein TanjilG_08211 [Lupinus angustifolius]|uniref:WPP domain-containing protein n=1 Tax=Lupinus angustifolius TaxID=3871 RepID=A0A1J7IS97_LUPAN|nr:PREDICTED: MFP1 attachment factor 1-like [Lupinus angustifolius]OIW15635.1 hypothetical protein TanjilG_08211 [Lupinus angustifolius]
MSDPEITPAPVSDQETTLPPPPQTEAPPQQNTFPNPSTTKASSISFSIWPPTQRTRDAVINRLIETLSTPSVLSKRYGTLSSDEASAAARQIEDEAFAAAGTSTDEDGVEILQAYSKEISKRMLDTVKARAPPATTVDNGGASDITAEDGVVSAASDS